MKVCATSSLAKSYGAEGYANFLVRSIAAEFNHYADSEFSATTEELAGNASFHNEL